MDIVALLACLQPLVAAVTLRHLAQIIPALLTMTGRARDAGTVPVDGKRGQLSHAPTLFFDGTAVDGVAGAVFPYASLPVGARVSVGGRCDDGDQSRRKDARDRAFFSGLVGQVVRGLEFFVLSLVAVTQRKAYPLAVQQTVRSAAEKEAIKARKKPRAQRSNKPQGKPKGRPKGSRNKDKNEVKLSDELLRINALLGTLLKLLRVFVRVKYLALDGHYGHPQAVLMAQQNDLQLISKLRKDAALCEPYEGEYSGHGPKRKYGARLNYEPLPTQYLQQSETQGDHCTQYYQGLFLHPEFGQALNVVIIVKTNVKTQKVGHVILLSSDAELGWGKLVDYYSLRFQIEFNFRDAQQHFGLEDFMNTTATGVENAAHLSFLLVNVSAKLLADSEAKEVGVLDLKTRFRGCKYALEAIKMLLEKPETLVSPDAIEDVKRSISQLGRIHRTKAASSSA